MNARCIRRIRGYAMSEVSRVSFCPFLCVLVLGWLLIATVGLLGTSLGVTAIVAEN